MKSFFLRASFLLPLFALHVAIAPPAHAQARPEIAVLIATQVGADNKPLATPRTVTAIVEKLAAETGLNLVVQSYPWRRAQMMAENGEGLLYGAAITPERSVIFSFSKPLYFVHQWLVTSAERSFPFNQWEDLRGKVISIQSGSKFPGEFETYRDKIFKVEENSTTYPSRMKMLGLGRVDAVLIDSYRGAHRFEDRLNCLYPELGRWRVLEKPAGREPLLIAVPKNSPLIDLLPALNQALERLDKSNGIRKILDAPVQSC